MDVERILDLQLVAHGTSESRGGVLRALKGSKCRHYSYLRHTDPNGSGAPTCRLHRTLAWLRPPPIDPGARWISDVAFKSGLPHGFGKVT